MSPFNRFVCLLPPSLQWVPWLLLAEALRFSAAFKPVLPVGDGFFFVTHGAGDVLGWLVHIPVTIAVVGIEQPAIDTDGIGKRSAELIALVVAHV
jgi:hypothetical protein